MDNFPKGLFLFFSLIIPKAKLIGFDNFNVSVEKLIEIDLGFKFQSKTLTRIIKESNDLVILKEIAVDLLKLNQFKSAIANWVTRRVA